jgi:hypothetical protein
MNQIAIDIADYLMVGTVADSLQNAHESLGRPRLVFVIDKLTQLLANYRRALPWRIKEWSWCEDLRQLPVLYPRLADVLVIDHDLLDYKSSVSTTTKEAIRAILQQRIQFPPNSH